MDVDAPQTPQETPQEAPPAAEGPTMDERFDQLGSRLDEKFNELAERLPEQQPAYDPNYGMDPALMDPQAGYAQPGMQLPQGYDPAQDPAMQGAVDPYGQDPAQSQQALAQMVQQAVTPYQQQVQVMRMEQDAERLQQEFPELKEPEAAGKLWDAATNAAAQAGNPELAWNPNFMRLVYQAGKASESAASEQPAGAGGPDLEGSGVGAPPATESDPAQDIVNAGQSENPSRIFGF